MENSISFFAKIQKIVRRPVFWILAGVFSLFAFLFGYLFAAPAEFPVNAVYKVEEGSPLGKISLDLANLHLIRSRAAFEFFVTLAGGERRIKEGYYLFDQKIPVYTLGFRMERGERHLSPIKITVPEGSDLKRIAEIFSAKLPLFDTAKFLIEGAGNEGYLFPDTYFFYSPENEKDALKKMRDNFLKKAAPLFSEIKTFGPSEKDIIIMASLLEKEAKGEEDRSIISGILWKRLAMGIPLQVDAVPETYKKKGLPEKPVGNPGLGSIKDALYPKSSPYLYYLHDKKGLAHYAATFAEHQKNIQRYLQ